MPAGGGFDRLDLRFRLANRGFRLLGHLVCSVGSIQRFKRPLWGVRPDLPSLIAADLWRVPRLSLSIGIISVGRCRLLRLGLVTECSGDRA